MTEKRFRLIDTFGDYHICNGEEYLCYDLCSPTMAKENWNNVVKELNGLYEENQYLKSLKWNQDCINEISIGMQQQQLLAEQNNRLQKENEQLKRRVRQLEDNIMNKIEIISGNLRIV